MNNLIFFGSDQYSAVTLATLLEHRSAGKLENIIVVTDQRAGGSEVEKLANKHNLLVSYYPTNPDEMINFVSTLKSWFVNTLYTGLCASFDHLIPANIIELFAGNLYNLHPSLLPQYRNVSPVQYAIAMGDKVTGITLFRISPGIDDGEIIAQSEEPIISDDTTQSLTPRLFKKGAELFLLAITNKFAPTGLPENWRTGELIFTHRLTRDSGFIEWPALHKLLTNQPISPSETKNELLTLRLGSDLKGSAQPADSKAGRSDPEGIKIISDLLRALTPWPTVWTTIPTKKGELRVVLESVTPDAKLKIAGKPNAISLSDFEKYYLK